MTKVEFAKSMKKLEINFARELTDEQRDFFWEEMKNTSKDDFIWIVKKILENEDFFPKLVDFKQWENELFRIQREQEWQE